MLLVIDNYDSFTYNLVHYFQTLHQTVSVFRNDVISIDDIAAHQPTHIVISPGPGRPEDAGITLECIRAFSGKIPILGVCLGHQAIAHTFGADIIRARKCMHGKTSFIYHNQQSLFSDLKNPFIATRYHSLVIDRHTLSDDFEIIAWTQEATTGMAEIMGIRHKRWPLYGVQFHPEAVLTEMGHALLQRFLVTMR